MTQPSKNPQTSNPIQESFKKLIKEPNIVLNLLKILHQIGLKAHHSFLPVLDGEPPPFTMLWHENSGHWVFLYLVCIG